MYQIRKQVRFFILSITGFILLFISLRILFDILNITGNNQFTIFIYNTTNYLVSPFFNVFYYTPSFIVNPNDILAFFVYLLSGLIIAEIITSFMYDNVSDIILNFVDGFFKLLEMLLVLRFIFDLFKVPNTILFSNIIYSITNPFSSAIPLSFLDGRINIGIVLMIIVLIFLDSFTEVLLGSLLPFLNIPKNNKSAIRTSTTTASPAQNININFQGIPVQTQMPPSQNVNVNMVQPKRTN